jgi:hypothetical protein
LAKGLFIGSSHESLVLNQAREALPETERRESPAASEAAAMVLMEVIGLKGMGGWGGVSPDEHTISGING